MKDKHLKMILDHVASGFQKPTQAEIVRELDISQPDFYRVFYKALKQQHRESTE